MSRSGNDRGQGCEGPGERPKTEDSHLPGGAVSCCHGRSWTAVPGHVRLLPDYPRPRLWRAVKATQKPAQEGHTAAYQAPRSTSPNRP